MLKQIDAKNMHYQELNQKVKALIKQGASVIHLNQVNGQRYIADALAGEQEIIIHGLAGNDLAMFMDGLKIVLYGNAQDGVANTMNKGLLIIHGSAGDALAYGMRGGEVYVRDELGYRGGIHMKSYQEDVPVLVLGGKAGDFLGEYMAGGLIVVLNLKQADYAVGKYCASGMHGGQMYIRGSKAKYHSRIKSSLQDLNADDLAMLEIYLSNYENYFQQDLGWLRKEEFFKVVAGDRRLYKKLYVGV